MAVADEVVAARSKSLQKSHFSGLVRDVLIDLEELAKLKSVRDIIEAKL